MDALSNLGNKLSKPLGFFEKHGYGLGNIATAVSRSGLIPNKYVGAKNLLDWAGIASHGAGLYGLMKNRNAREYELEKAHEKELIRLDKLKQEQERHAEEQEKINQNIKEELANNITRLEARGVNDRKTTIRLDKMRERLRRMTPIQSFDEDDE